MKCQYLFSLKNRKKLECHLLHILLWALKVKVFSKLSFEHPSPEDFFKKVYLMILFVLRFYGPVNPIGSCRAWSVYLTTRLLGRLSPLSG